MKLSPLFLLLFFLCAGMLSAQQREESLKNPEQLYLYAAGLMQRHFNDLAYPQLKNFVERYPQHEKGKEALRMLIYCSNDLKKNAETIQWISLFRKRWPEDSWNESFAVIAAVIYYSQENYQNALQEYEALAKSGDGKTAETGMYYSAQCQIQLKQETKAFELLKELAERPLNPEFPYRAYAVFFVAGELEKQGKPEDAIALYQKLCDAPEIPAEIQEKGLLRLADLEYERKDFSAALKNYGQYLESFPQGAFVQYVQRCQILSTSHLKDHPNVVKFGKAWEALYPESGDFEIRYLLAESLLELKHYEEVLDIVRSLVLQKNLPEPYRISALLLEITCLACLERHEELMNCCNSFLEKNPNHPEKGRLYFQIGQSAVALKQWSAAEKYFSNAMEFFIGEKELFLTAADALSQTLQQEEKWADAAAISRRMATLAPPNLQAAYHLQIAHFEFKAQNWTGVIQETAQIQKQFPNQKQILSDALQLRIHASLALEEYETARQALESQLKLAEPALRGEISLLLAKVLLQLKQPEKTIATLKQAMTSTELPAEVRMEMEALLLELYLQNGDTKNALPVIQRLSKQPLAVQQGKIPPELWHACGALLMENQRYAEAKQVLALCHLLKPTAAVKIQAGLLLAEIHLLQGKLTDAASQLTEIQQENKKEQLNFQQEIASLQAELFLRQKQPAQAFAAAEQCFTAEQSNNLRVLTRARWVMAKLLFEEEHDAKRALPYSIKCFVLADDPIYSPRAMELAIDIYHSMENKTDAATTWKELQQRYPIHAAGLQSKFAEKKTE